MTNPPDPAIAAALTRHGLDPNDHTGRDTAQPTTCPHCGAQTLTGLDDTIAALKTTTDTQPITIRDEAAAWLSNPPRPTYRLHTRNGRIAIRARNHWQISATPPGPGVWIVAAHRCHQPLGDPVNPQLGTQRPADKPRTCTTCGTWPAPIVTNPRGRLCEDCANQE